MVLHAVFAAALTSALLQYAAAIDGNYIVLANRNSGGGALYGGAPTWETSEAGCRATCIADPQCNSFTWHRPASGSGTGACYRKNTCDSNAILQAAPNEYSGILSNDFSLSDSGCKVKCGSSFVTIDDDSCSLAAPTMGKDYIRFEDRDSGGGALYYGAPIWVSSEATCQQACSGDPACNGYTWVRPAAGGNGPCYRKSTNSCDAGTLMLPAPGKYSGVLAGTNTVTSTDCIVQCGKNTVTLKGESCTVVTPKPTSSTTAQRIKRAFQLSSMDNFGQSSAPRCPANLTACSLGRSAFAAAEGYECVDLADELERCGDCDNDCTAIPGARSVTCSAGRCIINSCARNWHLVSRGDGHCERSNRLDEHPRRRLAHKARRGGL